MEAVTKFKASSGSTPEVMQEIVEGAKQAMAGKRITKIAGIGGVRYQCKVHGEHNGSVLDGKQSPHCPICLRGPQRLRGGKHG